KDGSIINTLVSSVEKRDEKGNVTGYQGTIHDITGEIKEEQKRRKLEEQLARSQKMESLGILAGGVAHDLNNILTGIVSYPQLMSIQIDMILQALEEGSPEKRQLSEIRNNMETIMNSGQRAADVVQDLLTLARRGISTLKILNLNDIVSNLLSSPEFDKLKNIHPHVQYKINTEPGLLNIRGSEIHIFKALMNLVINASEAMPGGGEITITTANRYIDKPIRGYDHIQEGDYAVLRVADNGVGIPQEDLQRIFEPFYTKKIMGRSGTGLGMAVVWGTVKDHSGYIDIESAKNEGTTCCLYFPATREEVEKKKAFISAKDYLGNGETILIVDDIREQREIASQILTAIGYAVEVVSSGEEAIEYVKEKSFNLLLLDMIMDPGIDGLDTYLGILEIYPKQKAVIASGFAETERVKEAQKLGAGVYVKKPYTIEKLGMAVRNELDK
ncbi:MAG: ATP-binding protein, partial [Gemmatimonadota bacterium]|nr:ATP-binding protein [Gemmatimonadota bacterium]